MNLYIAYGTEDYLSRIVEKHPNENMCLIKNADRTLLLHETMGKTIFKEGHPYEVIDSAGSFPEEGFVVFNNIPVRDEGRPVFEDRFQNRPRLIENEPGFQTIRVLRPLKSDTYIILTIWEGEHSFKSWQQSRAYEHAHKQRGTKEGIDQKASVFSGSSYVTNYYIVTEE